MYCSISGLVPDVPVVSAKSGHVFEKRLIEKALAATGGLCPETGLQLTPADLIEVRKTGSVVAPILPDDAGSVSGILSHLQREWDAMALEMHQVKTKLNETRKELANALYKNDAAEKVIARLQKEKEDLHASSDVNAAHLDVEARPIDTPETDVAMRGDIANPPIENGAVSDVVVPESAKGVTDMAVDSAASEKLPTVLPSYLLDEAKEKGVELQTHRKQRTVPASFATSSQIAAFSEQDSVSLAGDNDAITCVATRGDGLALAASSNGRVFSITSHEGPLVKRESVAAHTEDNGGVSTLKWNKDGNRAVSAGGDGLLKVWDVSEGWVEVEAIQHSAAVAEADLHPVGGLVLCALTDGRWVWRDLEAGGKVVCGGGGGDGVGISSAATHPDGMIFATGGEDGVVRMWDMNSMQCVAELGKGGRVLAVEMSEKGYYMACCGGGAVRLWDLRKQVVSGEVEGDLSGVGFDGYGEFGCGVGTEGIRLFVGKKKAKTVGEADWEGAKRSGTGTGRLGCAWGKDAQFVLAGGIDGVVRRFGEDRR